MWIWKHHATWYEYDKKYDMWITYHIMWYYWIIMNFNLCAGCFFVHEIMKWTMYVHCSSSIYLDWMTRLYNNSSKKSLIIMMTICHACIYLSIPDLFNFIIKLKTASYFIQDAYLFFCFHFIFVASSSIQCPCPMSIVFHV